MNILNSKLYPRCPRAIYLESMDARYLVNVYFSCLKTKTFPYPGSSVEQPSFTIELFDFLDEKLAQHKLNAQKASEKP
jgi:hypothetical protein